MIEYKRGDIVARDADGQVEYCHLDHVGTDGKMQATSDTTGGAVGLDARRDALRVATMEEVLEARARRAPRPGPAGRPGGGV